MELETIYLYNADDWNKFAQQYNNGEYSSVKIKVELLNDLDFTDKTFTAINEFEHEFNGHHFTLKNISLSDGKSGSVAIFKKLSNGTIKNLKVNGEIKGSVNVAGIVGIMQGGLIVNCVNFATISTLNQSDTNKNVGGIVGSVLTVAGKENIVNGCKNSGDITGYENVGGIVGSGSSIIIKNCYNTGIITAKNNKCGGIVGFIAAISGVKRCYNIGQTQVLSVGMYKSGAIVGWCDTSCGANRVKLNYYLIDTAPSGFGNVDPEIPDIEGSTIGKTSSLLAKPTTYKGWNFFTTRWNFIAPYPYQTELKSYEYPILSYEFKIENNDISWFKPEYKKQHIKTVDQFGSLIYLLRSQVMKNIDYVFYLDNDIDFNNKVCTLPIASEAYPFKFTFDGCEHAFYNLNIIQIKNDTTVIEYGSIFGFNTGSIYNLSLHNINSYSESYSSTIISAINDGLISNIKVFLSKICSTIGYISGICGVNKEKGIIANSTIVNTDIQNIKDYQDQEILPEQISLYGVAGICISNYGLVTDSMILSHINTQQDSNTSGIVVDNYGIVSGCNDTCRCDSLMKDELVKFNVFNKYRIKGVKNVAGIVANNYNLVTLSTNRNNIFGLSNVAGIVANNLSGIISELTSTVKKSAYGKISYCYNLSDSIKAQDTIAAGICGTSLKKTTIDSCYSDNTCRIKAKTIVGGLAGSFKGNLFTSYACSYIDEYDSGKRMGSLIGVYCNNLFEDGMIKCIRGASDLIEGIDMKTIGSKYDEEVIQPYDTEESVSVPLSDMYKKETYPDFDFVDIWTISKDKLPSIRIDLDRDIENVVPKADLLRSLGTDNRRFNVVNAKYIKGSIDINQIDTKRDNALIIDGNVF